jgi:hypothetical protein
MAIVQADVDKLVSVQAKLAELRATVEGSLSIRAVGGVYVANELIKLKPVLDELKATLDANKA